MEMSKLIGVVRYGKAGNIHSINKALKKAGANTLVVSSPSELEKVDSIVIPGVGSFSDAMQSITNNNMDKEIIAQSKHKNILGICLGMQIFSSIGFEYGLNKGLDIIDAEVKHIICEAKVPHMGFNKLEIIKKSSLLSGVEDAEFYFMHSYEVVNYTDILTLTEYVGHKFVSSVQKNNIYGVQFHPEKSRDAGIEVFKNFINL